MIASEKISPWVRLCAACMLALSLVSCGILPLTTAVNDDAPQLIDGQATPATQALYRNLAQLAQHSVLFGHQDTLAYGVQWVDEPGRSDVHSVTGAYPAVYGWELGDLELGAEANLDDVNFKKMQDWIKQGFERGGVITVAWHTNSPLTGASSWEVVPTVEHIIPGGSHHAQFKEYLDTLADFLQELTYTDSDGQEQLIPVIFRPWHEHNGAWFWWGKDTTSEADYIALWRFTVDYLRDEKALHNLIYAFSPDRSRIDLDSFDEDYFYGYPGDDYVDILGIDNYHDFGSASGPDPQHQQQNLIRSLEQTVRVAQQRNKIAALSEGGLDGVGEPYFWTERLLAALNANDETRQIAYALMWRNANREKEQREHFYVPYPGQMSADDFVRFYQHPLIMFGDTLPNLYQ